MSTLLNQKKLKMISGTEEGGDGQSGTIYMKVIIGNTPLVREVMITKGT